MATPSTKTHFGPELFTFLRKLTRNNNREWFEKHKLEYVEHVRDPLLRFVADFNAPLRRISPHFIADPRPHGGSMFRIYRDIRFSKNKQPYKTAATAQFRHRRGKDVHAPGFYLHLGADEVYGGTGLWHPDGPNLGKIRDAIIENPTAWKRAISGKAFREHHRLGGESLKRPPRGYDVEHRFIEDLKRKDFVSLFQLDEAAVCSPEFLVTYTKLCRAATPFMKFLTSAVEVEW